MREKERRMDGQFPLTPLLFSSWNRGLQPFSEKIVKKIGKMLFFYDDPTVFNLFYSWSLSYLYICINYVDEKFHYFGGPPAAPPRTH